jgi:hypothetical protein
MNMCSFLRFNRPTNGPCPVGYTCDLESMSNCTELRDQYIYAFQLGMCHKNMFSILGSSVCNKIWHLFGMKILISIASSGFRS